MFKKFFWTCSGADLDVLSACPKSEQEKYAGIGATVFFTAVMAFLSGSYALFTVFDALWAAVLFGAIWGLLIFNLDRFIVSTMRKGKGLKSEFIQASPRIILAILIAFVISKPLELKIFEKEIDRELLSLKNDYSLGNQDEVKAIYAPEISRLENEIIAGQKLVSTKKVEVDALYDTYISEAEGTAGTKLLGKGPVYEEKREKHDAALADLANMKFAQEELKASNTLELAEVRANMDSHIASTQPIIDRFDGFMARIEALSRLPQWPQIFILLLFIAIETAPIFAKLVSKEGPYDAKLGFIESEILSGLKFKTAQNSKLIVSESLLDDRVYASLQEDDEDDQYRKQRARVFLNAKTDHFFDKEKVGNPS